MANLAQLDFKLRRRLRFGSPCGTLPERLQLSLESRQIEATDPAYSVTMRFPARPSLWISPLQRLEFTWWAEELHMPMATVGDLVRLMDLMDRRFDADGSGPAPRLQ